MFMNHMLMKVSLLCGTASAASLGVHPWAADAPSPYLSLRGESNSSASYCNFGDSGAGNVTARSLDQYLHRLTARARPLKRPSPLTEPGDDTDKFLDQLQQDAVDAGNRIEITPPKSQWEDWLVGPRSHKVPVGATAQWKAFGETPERWMMAGMSGCTGTIILSEDGLWGSHLWEALGVEKYRESTLPHKEGPSAFLRRTGEGADDNVERTASEFKAVALDILNQATPDDADRPLWVSFADLKNQGDPFSDGSKVEGLILTKARTPAKTSMRYTAKINSLSNEYKRLIPDSTWKDPVLYIGDKTRYPSGFPMNLAGTIGIQYTPWQRTDEDKNRVARVEVFAENNATPVIVKEWVRNPSS